MRGVATACNAVAMDLCALRKGAVPATLIAMAACAPEVGAPRPTSNVEPGRPVAASAEASRPTSAAGIAADETPRGTPPPSDLDPDSLAEVARAERALAERRLDVPAGSELRLACCVATSVAFGPVGVPLVWRAPLPAPFVGTVQVETGYGLGFGAAPLGGGRREVRRPFDLDGFAAVWPSRRARAERDLRAALAHAEQHGRTTTWAARTLEVVVGMPNAAGTAHVYVHARSSRDDDTLDVELDAGGIVTAAYTGPGRMPLR